MTYEERDAVFNDWPAPDPHDRRNWWLMPDTDIAYDPTVETDRHSEPSERLVVSRVGDGEYKAVYQ